MEQTSFTDNVCRAEVRQRGNEVLIILNRCRYSELENHMDEISRYAVPYNTVIHFHTKTITVFATKTEKFSDEGLKSLMQRFFGQVNT